MTRNKGTVIASVSLSVLLIALQIFLGIEIWMCRDSLEKLSSRLDLYREHADGQAEKIEKEMLSLSDTQREVMAGMSGMRETLELLGSKSDAQIKLASGIQRSFGDLFEEQKKKTHDTTAQDSAVAQAKREAENFYSEGNYAAAYREFVKVLAYQGDDMESRLKKMKSLYYMNRTDSSKYSEILDDIKILRLNGRIDNEVAEIERIVTMEREGLDE